MVDTYVNDRRQTPAFTQPWEYDDEGDVLFDLEHRYKLDAAGRHVESIEAGLSITQGFDGDGRIVRRTEVYAEPAATLDFYSIRSTALMSQEPNPSLYFTESDCQKG